LPAATRPDVSLVVPVYNERDNLAPLLDEIAGVLRPWGRPYEVVAVDDGSTDGSSAELRRLAGAHPELRVVAFARNAGQSAAFGAGFRAARAVVVVTLDADLQNDPADIPRMLELARTHDIVCGWRKDRKDAYLTRHVPSVVANWLLGRVSGIRLHDNGCSLKVFRAEVVKPLKLSPGMHRYLPALASQLGGRVAEVVVNHRPRRSGRSKYGLSRTFGVLRDIVRLPRLMRQATDPAAPAPRLYEIAQILEIDHIASGC